MASEPERKPGLPGASVVSVKHDVEEFDHETVHGWLEEAGHRKLAENVDRLAADFEWINDLALFGFTGAEWDFFVEELAKYGMAVIGGWMYTGQVFEKYRKKGLGGLPSMDRRFDKDEIEELMGETVAKALQQFRGVLIKKKWDYRKGASLRTYFIGQCLIRFSNVYRRWHANEMRNRPPIRVDEKELLGLDSKAKNPADQAGDWAAATEALSRVKDPRVRKAMILTAAGNSQAEIAIELEVTERAVERMLANQRDRFRRETA